MNGGKILKISSFCSPKKQYQQRHSSQKQVSISVLQSKVRRRNVEEYDDSEEDRWMLSSGWLLAAAGTGTGTGLAQIEEEEEEDDDDDEVRRRNSRPRIVVMMA